jgi:hypothetical protein
MARSGVWLCRWGDGLMWASMWGEQSALQSGALTIFIVMTTFSALFIIPYMIMVALGRRKFALRTEHDSEYTGFLGFCFNWRVAIGLVALVVGMFGWYNTRLIKWPLLNVKIPSQPYLWTKACTEADYKKVVDISIDLPLGCKRPVYYIKNWHRYGWYSVGKGGTEYYRIGNDAFGINCGGWYSSCDVGRVYRDVFVVKGEVK